jgi:predicted component of type VI protein secretion system
VSGSIQLKGGRSVPVVDGLIIGRAADCGVVLDDEKASRHHARFVVEVGVVEIVDLESRNGTLLNGTRVQRRLLRDGDVITVGRLELTYRTSPAPSAAKPAAGAGMSGAAMPGAGEDLFGDDEAATAPPPPPAPRVPPPPPPPAPKAGVAPPSAPPKPRDLDLIEFADDEVVAVRKPAPAPAAPASPSGGAAPARAPAAAAAAERKGGVLQFSAKAQKGGVLRDDVGQLGGLRRVGVVVLGLAVAAGLGWLAMQFLAS